MLDLLPSLAMSFIFEQHGSNMRPWQPLKNVYFSEQKKIMKFLINALRDCFCIDIVLQMIDYIVT